LLEEGDEALRVGLVAAEVLGVEVHRRVNVNGDEFPGQKSAFAPFQKSFARSLGLDLFGVLECGLEGAELLDERDGGLLAHSLNPGDVVGGVAHQAEDVADLLGRDAEALDDGLAVNDLVVAAADVEEFDVVADELHEVLVAGDDVALPAFGLGLPGDRAYQVVGLVARALDGRDAEALGHLVNQRQLLGHLVGHLLARGLVVGELLVAKRRLRAVEDHRDALRRLLLQQAQEARRVAVNGAGVLALGVVEGVADEREIGAIGEGRAINEEESRLVAHGRLTSRGDSSNGQRPMSSHARVEGRGAVGGPSRPARGPRIEC